LQLDQTETETYIQGQNAQAAINNITTYYDQAGGMATFCSSTFTNLPTNQQQELISAFVFDVKLGQATMQEDVTTIDSELMPGGFGETGLLSSWTTTFILSAATADTLYGYYLTLETYYAYLYSYLMKGASTYVDVEHYLYTNDLGYVTGTLTPMINAEVDQFQQCTYQMLLSQADFVNNFSTNATFVPRVAATNILFRNMFMAAQARGTNAYGLNAMILATTDAVTNGMPPIVAFYDWMPSPELDQRGPDASTYNSQPAVQYFSPVISNWISVTGHAYDCWSNGRMHATNQYAFLQYGFGTNLPLGNYPWYFLRSQPYDPAQQYGNPINIGRYDDSLNASSTGNVYGFFLAQLRNGGPNFFINGGASYFSTTTNTHQVLNNTSKQGATMQITGQYPAGTNVVVVSVVITNGPLDSKHVNNNQGDITVNAHALWSFTYDGQTSVTGALQYAAATYGSYQTAPAQYMLTTQSNSFVARIDVFDVTANSVCTSGVVQSLAINAQYEWLTNFNMSANTQGSLAIQFQPTHQYQVRAGWDCAAHDFVDQLDPGGFENTVDNGPWAHPFALNASLVVQGLAITFE
jgi:hypothetical protein